MFKQTSEHFQSSLFSKYHYRFKKCFSAQHCLVSILEKWKSATEEVVWRTLFINISKAFDCLSHDLLIVKLNAYGLACQLCDFYLMQRAKINRIYLLGRNHVWGSTGVYDWASLHSYVIYSLLWKTLTLQAMQVIHHTAIHHRKFNWGGNSKIKKSYKISLLVVYW